MKKQFLFLFFFAFFLAASTQIQAQSRIVSGTVKDMEGNALSGITVMIKGTTIGVSTNNSGQYKIKAGAGSVLVFSKRKFIKEEINSGSGGTIDVTLYPDTRKGKRKRKRALKKKK
ncbi:carboxypeptidase-like regulatory domain-containing protein [Microscilla marina]|uniref:Periplasmic beta-glucosidase n=1 Tax=Microscilla marina ATCC 23134 TaxID=313606 RepID=A1ZN23_MICM2|nr:carboxypeptidase-like regulatory domain-containing protein [Microscilla marina]EAY28204.1 periplasmic beta-glucosidase [Microscilla marina ATCC 23134]